MSDDRERISDADDQGRLTEYGQMEQWLDDHPEFVHDYFARKASRSMVDGWLLSHAISQGVGAPSSGRPQAGQDVPPANGSNSNSGANTPARKISAQEFERGGQCLKPMVSTVDGTPTFLVPDEGRTGSERNQNRKSRTDLKALDERELMYELVMDICHDLDVTSLCHKILQNVGILLNADRCSLFLVQGEKGTNSQCLVSKLFDVTVHSSLRDCVEKCSEIQIPWATGIIGHVAETGEPLNIPNAYEDPRFNDEIDTKTGYKTHNILSMPIKDNEGKVLGVAQAINKISAKEEQFDEHDEKVFASYLAFCGIGLRNARLYERSKLENKRNQLLLDLARLIFEEQSNVAALIHKIMLHTQSLLQCERCQVLLVDPISKILAPDEENDVVVLLRMMHGLGFIDFAKKDVNTSTSKPLMGTFSQVFDLQASDIDNDDRYHRDGSHEPRFSINIGITGYVAATGERLNIPDAYQDCRFDPAVDENSSFRTRSILCMPIKTAQGNVIGVAQLVNKLDGTAFTQNDENLFEAFAIFCGMGIHNTQMYEKAVRAMAKQRVALDVLSYHAAAPQEDVDRFKVIAQTHLNIPSAQQYNLYSYDFSDFHLDDNDTLKACIRMFLDLGFVDKFRIDYEVLCRWLLSVKRNYRNVTYHNWRHAFNVAQTMFVMITDGEMKNILGDLETLALLVGCLCHDLDHRGTNNQFQIKTMSPLAQLYSTSVMEHHHFDQCIMILNTKGNEILSNLTQEQYERVLQVLESAILATDLALYFRYRGEFFNLVDSERADWSIDEHRNLLRSMMMTACDVAAITKPWDIQQRVATLVADEFFEQGDLEKQHLKVTPDDQMNREKKDLLPVMQVGFIDTICMPVYKAFATLNQSYQPLLEGCRANRRNWQRLADEKNKTERDENDCENQNKEDH